jgi:predicted amino acid dehydrogenase
VYRYIPPRPLFDAMMHSANGTVTKGIYIETFIPPDELEPKFLRSNLQKVKEACEVAARLKIPMVSLGGFTSIILECAGSNLTQIGKSFFTTGNSLTAGFIVKNIEKACRQFSVDMHRSKLLVIGSTGDIGSACVHYFSGKVGELLLCARQQAPLKKQVSGVVCHTQARGSTDINDLMPEADIIICVASSLLHGSDWNAVKEEAIICDAGYPKNIDYHLPAKRIFFGGMGAVHGGFSFEPDYREAVYQFAAPGVVHGCLLEAIVLAMEGAPQAFSSGRGNITAQAIEKILAMAATHGVFPSPLFNSHTVWEQAQKTNPHEQRFSRTSATV